MQLQALLGRLPKLMYMLELVAVLLAIPIVALKVRSFPLPFRVQTQVQVLLGAAL